MKTIKQFFELRFAQTWQIICESASEEQVQKQFSLFMFSVYEKLIELCPIIKELLVDEGILRPGGGGQAAGLKQEQIDQQSQVMNEMLARLVNLQQFVQGGHGSNSRTY